jgi:hypothetical protein
MRILLILIELTIRKQILYSLFDVNFHIIDFMIDTCEEETTETEKNVWKQKFRQVFVCKQKSAVCAGWPTKREKIWHNAIICFCFGVYLIFWQISKEFILFCNLKLIFRTYRGE